METGFSTLLSDSSYRARHKKLAISTYKPPRILPLYKPGHDNKAYLVGQQRLQSMPQTLSKSRTNPGAKQHVFAIRN